EVRGGVIERAGKADETKCSHVSRRKLAGSYSCQGHNDEQGESSACERLSGAGCRVAHQLLQELGLKYSCGIQDTADQNHEETTDCEILVLEQPQINDGFFTPPLPPDQASHTRNKQETEDANEVGGKPIVLFTLIEHDLHAAHSDREQSEA